MDPEVEVQETTTAFRFNAKKIGLTYSCPVNDDNNPIETHEAIIEHLLSFGIDCEYLVSKELHLNGKTHWHAFAKWQHKLDTRDVRAFDINGVHPNIIRTPGKGWPDYVAKKGDFKTNFYKKNPWSVAMQLENLEACVAHLFEQVPRDLVLNHDKITYAYTKLNTRPPKARPEYRFTRPQESDLTRTLLVEGESGIGKTQWALRHFERPLLVSHLEDLKKLKPDTDGIVFDDMQFLHIPVTSQIHLCDIDEDRTIHIRYGTVSIPGGLRRIVCYNPSRPPFTSDPAIDRRCRLVRIDEDIRLIE